MSRVPCVVPQAFSSYLFYIWQYVYASPWVSQVALEVKNLPANAGAIRDVASILGSGRPPGRGHGNPLQYSCLENPIDRGAWWATVHRVPQSQTRLQRLSTHTRVSVPVSQFIPPSYPQLLVRVHPFFKLEDNCFTSCWFLPYNNVNQP